MKHALGIAVSGMEIRLAILTRHQDQIRVARLDKVLLKSPLDNPADDSRESETLQADANDVFGLAGDTEKTGGDRESMEPGNENLETLYALLEKHARNRIKVGFNIPLSMVKYQRPTGVFRDDSRDRSDRAAGLEGDSGVNWAREIIDSGDGSTIELLYEQHPPTLALLREAQHFLRGRMMLALMDTTEMALVYLARKSVIFNADEYAAIVYIEDEFSRIVFLHGGNLFHVSPIIHEYANSPDIMDIVYRKLIYEQDEAGIPQITSLLLAGRATRVKAKEYFEARFSDIRITYLHSYLLKGLPTDDSYHELFSAYAVPISLAWKLLQPQHPHFDRINLLPQRLRDQQEVLKLAYHGYILLALTGLTAFFFSWKILSTHQKIRTIRHENTKIEQKIRDNQKTVDRVLDLEDQSKRFEKNLALAENLSHRHDELLKFLQKLNKSTEETGSIWIDEIVKQQDGFTIKGASLNRAKIPVLAEVLEQASLKKVMRDHSDTRKLFRFELERRTVPESYEFSESGVRIITNANAQTRDGLVLARQDQNRPGTTTGEKPEPLKLTAPAKEEKKTKVDQQGFRVDTSPSPVKKSTSRITPERTASSPLTAVQPGKTQAGRQSRPQERNRPARQAANGKHGSADAAVARRTIQEKRAASTGQSRTESTPASASSRRNEKPATSRPVAESANARGYSIEFATTHTRKLAEQFANAIRKKGLDAAVDDLGDNSGVGKRFRVLVGVYASRPAAEEKASEISGFLSGNYRIVSLR